MKNNPISNNKISLSSWNYGSFSATNPFYNLRASAPEPIKIFPEKSPNINFTKEKIVTNNYFENLNYMRYINRENYTEKKRASSAVSKNKIKDNESKIDPNELSKKKKDLKTLSKKEKKNLSKKEKKKLEEEKKKLEEEKKMEENALKIGISFKKWNRLKKKEYRDRMKKMEEEEKNQKNLKDEVDKERRERYKEWFEIKNAEAKKRKNLSKQKKKKEKKDKEKEEKNEKIFKNWVKRKEKEKKIKNENEKKNSCNKFFRRKYTEVIGPYSFAKVLRQIQNELNNKEKQKYINKKTQSVDSKRNKK